MTFHPKHLIVVVVPYAEGEFFPFNTGLVKKRCNWLLSSTSLVRPSCFLDYDTFFSGVSPDLLCERRKVKKIRHAYYASNKPKKEKNLLSSSRRLGPVAGRSGMHFERNECMLCMLGSREENFSRILFVWASSAGESNMIIRTEREELN